MYFKRLRRRYIKHKKSEEDEGKEEGTKTEEYINKKPGFNSRNVILFMNFIIYTQHLCKYSLDQRLQFFFCRVDFE